MSWWNPDRHDGKYGGLTVTPPAWPEINEEALAQAANDFESFRDGLRIGVIPALRAQMMALSDAWDGAGSKAACEEASAVIDAHESHAEAADDVARRLRSMEEAVVRTKVAVNVNAEETQQACEAIEKTVSDPEAREALILARVEQGLNANIHLVAANTRELAGGIGMPHEILGANAELIRAYPMSEAPAADVRGAVETKPQTFHYSDVSKSSHTFRGGTRGEAEATSQAAANPPIAAEVPPPGSAAQPPSASSSAMAGSASTPAATNLGSAGGGTSSMGSSPSVAGSSTPGSAGKSPLVGPGATGGDSAGTSAGRPLGGLTAAP